jgi:hypothetical protein
MRKLSLGKCSTRPVCHGPMSEEIRITRPGGGVSLVFQCLHCGRRKKVELEAYPDSLAEPILLVAPVAAHQRGDGVRVGSVGTSGEVVESRVG